MQTDRTASTPWGGGHSRSGKGVQVAWRCRASRRVLQEIERSVALACSSLWQGDDPRFGCVQAPDGCFWAPTLSLTLAPLRSKHCWPQAATAYDVLLGPGVLCKAYLRTDYGHTLKGPIALHKGMESLACGMPQRRTSHAGPGVLFTRRTRRLSDASTLIVCARFAGNCVHAAIRRRTASSCSTC